MFRKKPSDAVYYEHFRSKKRLNCPRFTSRGFATMIFLFLVMIFVYQLRNQSSISEIQTSNVNPIEEALEKLAVCNSNDRPRQRALLLTLQHWSNFARQNNLQYWISFGTLIGYVQSASLLPSSVDLAVTIAARDTLKLKALVNRTLSEDFSLNVHPDWFRVSYLDRSYYPEEGIRFVAPNAQFVNRKEQVHIDIYPSYDYDPFTSVNITEGKKLANLTEYDPDYDWISYPKSWTFPLKLCSLSNVKVLCPAEAQNLIVALFGPAALNSSDVNCINGKWVESSDFS